MAIGHEESATPRSFTVAMELMGNGKKKKEQLILPVTFTCDPPNNDPDPNDDPDDPCEPCDDEKIFRDQPKSSREGLGVWHDEDDDKAWKIYAHRDVLKDVKGYYKAAAGADFDLPIGEPVFKKGKVKRGEKTLPIATKGFALVNRWFAGTEFKGPSRFKAALKREGIRHGTAQYDGIEAALERAMEFCLKDPQGFVNGQSDDEPVVFTDIHRSNSNQSAEALLEVLRNLK